MGGFSAETFIAHAPGAVFAFATNLDNCSKWLKQVTRIEKLTDGPLGVGTQFRETRMMGKREATSTIEITEHASPRVHAATAAFPGGQATYRYTFTPEGDGTRVRLDAKVEARGLGKLMAPIIVAAMKKQDGAQLEDLKEAMG